MESRKMTVTEGLAELKLLDARIRKGMSEMPFIIANSNQVLTDDYKDTAGKEIKAKYQSITDMIAERAKIKSAIVKSNASTKVKVGDEEYTVAEAIERKSSIGYERILLAKLKEDYALGSQRVDAHNASVQRNIDAMLSNIASSDKSDINEAQRVLSESYLAKNGWSLYDPLSITAKIDELDKRIDEFEKNVDIALSLSNAVTMIII